jgi:hypothetical protein
VMAPTMAESTEYWTVAVMAPTMVESTEYWTVAVMAPTMAEMLAALYHRQHL